jgi:hypothetical protein
MTHDERPSWWRSSSSPDPWHGSSSPLSGIITLPLHLHWSGPTSEFDLDDPADLRLVDATVLREGSADDVREWIDPVLLLEVWDSLWLPPAIHEAWDEWIRSRRLHAAV